jgi:outer membrane protein OmpA-like peptidoglycan-associated protein
LIRPVAYSAYYLKNYKKAIDLYNRLISLNTSEANVYDLFYLAQSYRSLENYPIADSITREINYKFPTVVVYPETSNWFKDDINYESEFFQSLKNLYGLDSAIVSPFESNSKYGEYGLISNNGKQYFTTNNPDFLGELTANNYRNERDFAIIERDGDSYTPILNVSGESCQLNYIDPTGEWFSITVTDTKPNDENKKILKSYLLKRKKALDGWDTMSLGLNNSKYSVTGVNIDAAGNRIFFSSNRPNGFGSSDLYTANIKEIDYNEKVIRLGRIENMGPRINTIGREGFPFLLNDSVLIFCSDGHLGYGNLDLFSFNLKTKEIYNLGDDINSSEDDFFFTPFDEKTGFFTKTVKNEGDNIYKIQYLESWLQRARKNEKQINLKLVPKNGDKLSDKISKDDIKVYRVSKSNKNLNELLKSLNTGKPNSKNQGLSPINAITLNQYLGSSPDERKQMAGLAVKEGVKDDTKGPKDQDPNTGLVGGVVGGKDKPTDDSKDPKDQDPNTGLVGGVVGGKDKPTDDSKDPKDQDPNTGLVGGVVGGKDKPTDDSKDPKDQDPNTGLIGGVVGGKDKPTDDSKDPKDQDPNTGLIGGVVGGKDNGTDALTEPENNTYLIDDPIFAQLLNESNGIEELPFEVDEEGNINSTTSDTDAFIVVLANPQKGNVIPVGAVLDLSEDLPEDLDLDLNTYSVGDKLNDILELNPIHYDFDKTRILPESIRELKKVRLFMNTKNEVNILVSSHTDSRGSYTYNMDLSLRRSISSIKYLVQNLGVEGDRLNKISYGEFLIDNGCVDDVKCLEKLHRFNRRTDFIIK